MILLSFGCDETGRGKTAALEKIRVDERGKIPALKMKTPRSYSEVPRWKLEIMKDAAKLPRTNYANLLQYYQLTILTDLGQYPLKFLKPLGRQFPNCSRNQRKRTATHQER